MSQESELIEVIGRSDAGLVRSHNEDSIGEDLGINTVVLADGMGGYKAGEVASAIAVNTVLSELNSAITDFQQVGETDQDTGYARESLAVREAIKLANSTIFQASSSQAQYKGMGTTIVVCTFYERRITVAHVGDSRMYRFRGRDMDQITVDHTLLQELIDRGFYTPEEAKESSNKNLVTRALGIEDSVAVDVQEDLAIPGDIYLLCSDGLNDMISDEEIHLTINEFSDNLDRTAEELIAKAKQNGGKDNVSVILVRMLGGNSGKSWLSKVTDWFF